jgi:hypothetical protein
MNEFRTLMLRVSVLFILSLSTLETSEIFLTYVHKGVELSRASRAHDNTTSFEACDGRPWKLGLSTRVRGGGSPALNSERAPRKSIVVNLLTPAERLLRKQLEEESLLRRTNAAAAIPDSNRTRMYKEGVRQLARYDYAPINTNSLTMIGIAGLANCDTLQTDPIVSGQ